MSRVESGPDPNGVPRVWTLLSVLMPLYNERRTLRAIVRRVLDSPVTIPLELIIVDDSSTDGSADLLRELAANEPRDLGDLPRPERG